MGPRDLRLVIFKTLWFPGLAVFLLFTAVALARAEPADPLPAGRDDLRAAALANDGDSQFQLGEVLLNDPSDMNDLVDAYAWFVLADRNGHARARYYKRGMGNVLDEEQQEQVAKRVADLTAAMEQGRDPDAASDGGAAVTDAAHAQSDDVDQTESREAPADVQSGSAHGPVGATSADLQAPGPADDAAASGADAGGRGEQGAEPAAAAKDTAEAPDDDGGAEVQRPEAAAPDDAPADSVSNDAPATNVSDSDGASTTAAMIQDPQPQAEQPRTERQVEDEEPRGDADVLDATGGHGTVQESAAPAVEAAPAAVSMEAAPAAVSSEAAPAAVSMEAAPAAVPVEAAPAARAALDPSALIVRGRILLAQGDIVSARALFELAADSGSGEAALLTGRTYDPAFVAEHRAVGFRGNAEQARRWYRTAIEMGAAEAQTALDQLAQ